MRKFVLTAVLVILSLKYGIDYLLSEKFQNYGDQKKAQWTCQVNNFLAGLFEVSSDYQRSIDLYDRVLTRCPESPMAEQAMFSKAYDLENLNHPHEAYDVYLQYRDAFPNSDKIGKVNRAIDRIRFSK
jgi:outer membrane protein assembly factor BamD (BamD/ComL family)